MSKPYDATTKVLVEKYPLDWLRQLGIGHIGPIRAINANLSAISRDADRVFLVSARRPWILHIEFQTSADKNLGNRMAAYNALLRTSHNMPIHSTAVLLRPAADYSDCTGRLQYQVHPTSGMDFRYQVVRIWEQSPEQFLEGGLGTLPLTPLTRAAETQLPDIIGRIDERIRRGRMSAHEARSLWTATYILMGLRVRTSAARGLLKGVMGMKDSVTYQAIVAEGRRKGLKKGIEKGIEKGIVKGRFDEARRMALSLGTTAFGKPSKKALDILNAIESAEQFEALAHRILVSKDKSWDDVLNDL